MIMEEAYCDGCKQVCEIKHGNVLNCSQCQLAKHVACVRAEDEIVKLAGDIFFDFVCANCSESGTDQLFRSRISWLCAILLSLYNLHINDAQSNKGYFHWKLDICEFISSNWIFLFGPKCKKKKTWQGVVSGNLSSNVDRLFISGAQDLSVAGWWRLKTVEAPALLLEKSKSLPPVTKPSEVPRIFPIAEPILLKRESRHSNLGTSLMNAIALKQKRDSLVNINTKTKTKTERKRKLKEEVVRKSKKKSENGIVPVSNFDSLWEMVKVGEKYVTMPKPGTIYNNSGHSKNSVQDMTVQYNPEQSKSTVQYTSGQSMRSVQYNHGQSMSTVHDSTVQCNQGKSTRKVIISKNETLTSSSLLSNSINLGNVGSARQLRTYRNKRMNLPSTVTNTLRRNQTDYHDLCDPFGGELKIDLSPRVAEGLDHRADEGLDPRAAEGLDPRADEGLDPSFELSPETNLNTARMSPDPPPSPAMSSGDGPLSSSPLSPSPVNPLVFLPQYELSHLDLGREVTLGDSFTGLEEETDSEHFLLTGEVEGIPLHTDGEVESIPLHIESTLAIGDESIPLHTQDILHGKDDGIPLHTEDTLSEEDENIPLHIVGTLHKEDEGIPLHTERKLGEGDDGITLPTENTLIEEGESIPLQTEDTFAGRDESIPLLIEEPLDEEVDNCPLQAEDTLTDEEESIPLQTEEAPTEGIENLPLSNEAKDGDMYAEDDDMYSEDDDMYTEDNDVYIDSTMAEAMVDRTAQPSLEDIFGDLVKKDSQNSGWNSLNKDTQDLDSFSAGSVDNKDSFTKVSQDRQSSCTYDTQISRDITHNKKVMKSDINNSNDEQSPCENNSYNNKNRRTYGLSDTVDDENRVLDRFQRQDEYKSPELNILLSSGAAELDFISSPYSGRKLKPFIRRDFDILPRKLKQLREIEDHGDEHNLQYPIDFCYIQAVHISGVNNLARQLFWPGIDMTEALRYPEFSCVVLYRKLVVGFGVLVPDSGWTENYLSYFLVHPDWSRAGIGSLMLYHLISCSTGKDLTLHVSASNPALILYQKFGFKVEEFVKDFYRRYLPEESRECRHALYMRLPR